MKVNLPKFVGLVPLLTACCFAAAQDLPPTADPEGPQIRPEWDASELDRLPPVGDPPPPHDDGPPGSVVPRDEGVPTDAVPTKDQQSAGTEGPADDAVTLAPAQPPPKPWEGSFELGVDGTEGNSQTFNLRFRTKMKRKSKLHVLSADLDYHRNSNDSVETANQAFLDWRCEHLFEPSPWTWFVHGTVEYDEFKAFDLRVAVDTGLGYRWIKTDRTDLLTRLGGGFSHEIGGPDDSYRPELVFGIEFEHKLTDRQKLTAKVDYMPDVTDFTTFRLTSDVGWQAIIDQTMNLSLKASVLDRYDSTPEGKKPNDLTYGLTLLWSY